MNLEQLNALLEPLDDPLLDESGNPLPKDKMWIVTDPRVTKEYQQLIAGKCGIEFRKAMIDGKLVTVSGL